MATTTSVEKPPESVDNLVIEVATFRHKRDTIPDRRQADWTKLAKRLTTHKERPGKDGPLWSPTVYRDGCTRSNEGVAALTAAVGDYDAGPAYELIKGRLSRYEYVAHSTYSHRPNDPHYRVVLPFAQPVPSSLWDDVKARIDEHIFGRQTDQSTKDPCRVYFLPSCPARGARFAEHHRGELLDPLLLPSVSFPTHVVLDGTPTESKSPLGKNALDFVANGSPLGQQRMRALSAARNYLSAGYSVKDTAEALWRGFQASPQDPDRGPWTYADAEAIAEDLASKDAPPLEGEQPLPPRCEMRTAGLGYVLQFPLDGVTVTVDHLRRGARGIGAEIVVEANLPAVPHNLYWGHVDLATQSQRDNIEKHCAKRAEIAHVDWAALLDEVCRKVAAAERSGEPFQRVGKLPPAVELTWLVQGFCPRNEGMSVFGAGGSGKSLMSLATALSVQTGLTFVPGFAPLATGPVLYLDWEAQPARLDQRVKSLCKGMGIPPVEVSYRRCAGALVDQIEEVMRFCQSEGVVLVVVDSVEAAMAGTKGGDSDPNDCVQRLYAALRLLKCSSILVDHIAKEGLRETRGKRSPIGGVAKENRARMLYELRKAEAPTRNIMNIGLYNTKRNDDGPLMSPVALRVEFGEGATRFYRDDLSTSDVSIQLDNAERIALVLTRTRQALTVQAIASEAGISEAGVRQRLSALRGSRFVLVQERPNLWALLDHKHTEEDGLDF